MSNSDTMKTVFGGEERRKEHPPIEGVLIPIWLASALVGVIFVGMGWMINQNITNDRMLAILGVKIEAMGKQIEQSMNNGYRLSDAKADFLVRDNQIQGLQQSFRDCEADRKNLDTRIRALESRSHNRRINDD